MACRALAAFGAPLRALGIEASDFTQPALVVQLGQPPYRIDVMSGIDGVTFDEAWADRVEHAFEDLLVPYLGLAAFIRNKRASGRTKDLADLEYLGEM